MNNKVLYYYCLPLTSTSSDESFDLSVERSLSSSEEEALVEDLREQYTYDYINNHMNRAKQLFKNINDTTLYYILLVWYMLDFCGLKHDTGIALGLFETLLTSTLDESGTRTGYFSMLSSNNNREKEEEEEQKQQLSQNHLFERNKKIILSLVDVYTNTNNNNDDYACEEINYTMNDLSTHLVALTEFNKLLLKVIDQNEVHDDEQHHQSGSILFLRIKNLIMSNGDLSLNRAKVEALFRALRNHKTIKTLLSSGDGGQ